MAASIRIEDEAFSDLRFDVLAKACGLADADHARGKMAQLWRQCTARNKYVLPDVFVDAVLGAGGAQRLVDAQLGRRTKYGVRIRGTKGRIEWLERLRANGKKGGRPPKKTSAKAKGSKRKTKSEAAPNPPAPAPVPKEQKLAAALSAAPPGSATTADELAAASGVFLGEGIKQEVTNEPGLLPVALELAEQAGDETRARAQKLPKLKHPGLYMLKVLRALKARAGETGSEHALIAEAERQLAEARRKRAKRVEPANLEVSCDEGVSPERIAQLKREHGLVSSERVAELDRDNGKLSASG